MKELMDESWTSWNNLSQSNGIENPDGVIARRGRVKREYYNHYYIPVPIQVENVPNDKGENQGPAIKSIIKLQASRKDEKSREELPLDLDHYCISEWLTSYILYIRVGEPETRCSPCVWTVCAIWEREMGTVTANSLTCFEVWTSASRQKAGKTAILRLMSIRR